MDSETKRFKLRQGLDLPIEGDPIQEIDDSRQVTTVAILGPDYIGMRPTMAVSVGDSVKLGQLLFTDKKTPGVRHTAPGSGTVKAIHRGEKRRLLSVEIEIDGNDDDESFEDLTRTPLQEQSRAQVRDALVTSGLWLSLRSRPYNKTPTLDSSPHSIFVNAMDTNPLAARPAAILSEARDAWALGLRAVSKLTDGAVYVCRAPGTESEVETKVAQNVCIAEFEGPHPSGLSGTHVHFLDPVGPKKTVWTIGYQDVIAIGRFFSTGHLHPERVVSLAGPIVKSPRLVRTRVGASTADLVDGELSDGAEARVVSGSVLSGHTATGPLAFLGRYDLQVSVVAEGREREFLGWQTPGFDKFSIKKVFAASLSPAKKFALTTSTGGSRRAMVPIGMYESVMPLDIVPTFLLRALAVDDTAQAQALGCLELVEEDLGLCTFVCPGKDDYGPILRRNLTQIEKEG